MKKNTLLYIILAILIVMNGFFIYNYLEKPKRQRGNPTEFIARELGFNEAQLESLKKLDDLHRVKMRRTDDEIKVLKDALFGNLPNTSVKPSTIDSLTTLIGIKVKEKDMISFYHFRTIQEICNDKQKKHFQKILKNALHPKGKRRREGGPPPRKH